jgi:hypothetical protein
MFRRLFVAALLVVVAGAVQAPVAEAQQSVSFQLGGFFPRSEDGREATDVLVVNRQYLLFDFSDFNGVTVGGDWSIALGEYFEVVGGVAFYQRTVPAIYEAWVDADGTEIQQDLKLRLVPITAMARILPLGSRRAFQPYVAVGLGIFPWRYSETGEFVDFAYNNDIYRETYVDTGTSVGPVAAFGARGRLSSNFMLGAEIRLQWAKGDLSQDFLGDHIDLGGWNFLSTFSYRF